MPTHDKNTPGILLVANYDSNVGYAWWLMESYWNVINDVFSASHNVHLCYPSISKIPELIESSSITTHKFDLSPTTGNLRQQIYFLRKHNIQCIYFSDQAAVNPRYIIYRLCGVKKIIVHDHTPGIRAIPTGIRKALKIIMMRLPFITADAIIGATAYVQRRAIEVTKMPPRKTFAVNNGIPDSNVSEYIDAHKRFNIPSSKKIMICTGRAIDVKGIDFVLHCISKLVHEDHRTDLHFLFCGDGPHLDKYKKLTESLSINEYVSLPGRLTGIEAMLPSCAFAIHASIAEVGYSLSILEYMQAKLPVIIPDNPSVCGATSNGETGLIYAENNIQSACSAIKFLLDNPATSREMGAKAQREVEEKYTITQTHRELVAAIYQIYPANKSQAVINAN